MFPITVKCVSGDMRSKRGLDWRGVAYAVVLTALGSEGRRSGILRQQGFEVKQEGTWAGQEEEWTGAMEAEAWYADRCHVVESAPFRYRMTVSASRSLPDAGPGVERTLKPVTFPAQTRISKRLLRHRRVVNCLRLGVETRSSKAGISSNGRKLVDSISQRQTLKVAPYFTPRFLDLVVSYPCI